MFIGHLSDYRRKYSLQGTDRDLWKPIEDTEDGKEFLKRCHVFTSGVIVYQNFLKMAIPATHVLNGQAPSVEIGRQLVEFLKQGGVDLDAGPDEVFGREIIIWTTNVDGTGACFSPPSYAELVDVKEVTDADFFITRWNNSLGVVGQRVLRSMQSLAITMAKRESVYIQKIIEFKALLNQKIFIGLAAVAVILII